MSKREVGWIESRERITPPQTKRDGQFLACPAASVRMAGFQMQPSHRREGARNRTARGLRTLAVQAEAGLDEPRLFGRALDGAAQDLAIDEKQEAAGRFFRVVHLQT